MPDTCSLHVYNWANKGCLLSMSSVQTTNSRGPSTNPWGIIKVRGLLDSQWLARKTLVPGN